MVSTEARDTQSATLSRLGEAPPRRSEGTYARRHRTVCRAGGAEGSDSHKVPAAHVARATGKPRLSMAMRQLEGGRNLKSEDLRI